MTSTSVVASKPRDIHCKWCDRSFNKGEHLRRHERSHTGAKPFACKVCKRSFNRQDSLMRHGKLHASESSQYPSPASVDTNQSGTTLNEELTTVDDAISATKPLSSNLDTLAFPLEESVVTDEAEFGLVWPDSASLFQSIVSFDNRWQLPLDMLPVDTLPGAVHNSATSTSFEDRVSSISAIPTGANHQAVHNVSKMITSLSSSVTAAVEATSINSVFLDECLHMFFVKFVPTFPILHRATFIFRECTPPLLLNAIAIGSLYLGPKDAVAKGEALWSLAHTAITTSWQTLIAHRGSYDSCDGVQLVIAVFLAQLYGALSRNRSIRTSSQALRSMGLFWARQCGMFDTPPFSLTQLPTFESSEAEKQCQWRLWVAREIQQRALLAHYMLDGLISQISGALTSVRHTANNLTLPHSEDIFDASNATDWLLLMQSRQYHTTTFRDMFRLFFAPIEDPLLHEHDVSALSYKVILEGLHNLASESRDGAETIGVPSSRHVQTALARSYQSINGDHKLHFAEKHEVLLRWHAICLESIVDTSALCVCLCRDRHVEQVLWKSCRPTPTLSNLSQWAASVEARRALLHAVAIQEIIEQLPRGRAHAIHMPHALFSASMIYSVFISAGSTSVRLPSTVNWEEIVAGEHQQTTIIESTHLHSTMSATLTENQRYLRGEPLFGTTAVARNLLYELNSMQKLFRCLCAQWGIACDMAEIIDQLITLCH